MVSVMQPTISAMHIEGKRPALHAARSHIMVRALPIGSSSRVDQLEQHAHPLGLRRLTDQPSINCRA
jgi:hypothetical protein